MDDLTLNIPQPIENMQLPTPELLTFYKDLEERIFWIEEEISVLSLEIIRKILAWNREDQVLPIEKRKPIKLFFFSPGGDLDVNYSLIDVIKMSKTPIYGINIGRCCSAAAYIYLSCHKRFMLPHAYFVFHQGSGAFSGSYAEIVSQLEDYQKQVTALSDFMKERTKYTEDEIDQNIVTEWYVRKDEALEKGVCDGIIKSIDKLM
jgi:Protease subunit of ATP-dependent Clp proteases